MSKTIELAKHLEKLHINNMYKSDFYWTWDKTDEELDAIFTVADALRDLRERNKSTRIFDSGLGISIFRDNSTRTRFSFASACNLLGLTVQDLDEKKSQIAHGETVRETANMVSFMADVIGIRDDRDDMFIGEGHKYQKTFMDAVKEGYRDGILEQQPTLVNLQCDVDHPTQCMADMLHIIHHFGGVENLKGKKIAMTWAYSPSYGKPLSVPQGVIGLMTRFGMDVVLAHPEGYDVMPEVEEIAKKNAAATGGTYKLNNVYSHGEDSYEIHYVPSGEGIVAYFSPSTEVFATRSLELDTRYTFTGSRLTGASEGVREAVLACMEEDDPYYETVESQYLALPQLLDESTYFLAQQIIAQADNPFDQASALCNYLQRHFRYTLDQSVPPSASDFVSWFLFEEQQGYCTSFASAMAAEGRSAIDAARGYLRLSEAEALANKEDLGSEYGDKWYQNRITFFYPGHIMDIPQMFGTMDTAATYANIERIYWAMKKSINEHFPFVKYISHSSHWYEWGCMNYTRFIVEPEDVPQDPMEALRLHNQIWNVGVRAAMENGGVINDHHGIGLKLSRLMKEQYGSAMQVLEGLKKSLDPQGLMNPYKLGL